MSMKKRWVLLIFLLLFFSDRTNAKNLPEEFRINQVKCVGIKHVSKKELTKTLAAQPSPWWKIWLPERTLTIRDLEDDLLRIRQFYRAFGYYHTRASFQIKEISPDDVRSGMRKATAGHKKDSSEQPIVVRPLVNITFSVTEGPPVLLETITVKIDPPIENISDQTVLERLPLKTGGIFETTRYSESKKVIKTLLGNLGYPFAELITRASVNTDTNRAKISFVSSPGRKYAFGSLIVSDPDDFVKEAVIRRAMRFKKGETFSTDKVKESQRNLYNLDIFQTALIKPEKPDGMQDDIPVTIQLKPKKRQNVKFGIGYGSEDEFRIKGAWTYRNVWGWGGRISTSARRSSLIENAQVEYLQPYFLDYKNTLRSQTGIEREKFVSHTSRRVFGNAAFDRNFMKNWIGTLGYSLEINRIEDLNVTDPTQLEENKTGDDYLISSARADVVRDTTDNDLNPTKGSVVSASFEQGSTFLGSEITYYQPAVEAKKYLKIAGPVVWAGRFRIQSIQETENTDWIPIFKRFFLGGSNTVRGFGYQKLSPIDLSGNPIGGLSSINANVELRYPIYDQLSGVAFLDMGLVDKTSFHYNLEDMRYTCGLGIRYNTAIGPIRFDFGYKLNPPTRSDLNNSIRSDEEIEKRWRIHFSIGQAF